MAICKAPIALLVVLVISSCRHNEAQLLANIKNFLNNVPTFGSKDVPKFSTDGQRVYVSVPAPSNVNFGTVDPQTGTWAFTDKSLGAGVELGPKGASILSRNPTQGVDDFSQAARIGPDGVVIGPDKASAEVNRATDQALGNFGIKNLKFGPDGIQINDGNRLNSSITVNNQGIQLQGNPTGGGESHLFIKPNLRVGDEQIAGAAAPAKQPSNVQISVGDGKSTATEQLQGYTNYQLNPQKGTYNQVGGNSAPPFMGVDPNGKPYTSFARAPAPGPDAARLPASAAAASQQGLLPQNAAMGAGAAPNWAPLAAPGSRVQLVSDKPLPRQYMYGGDLVRGTPQSAAAYTQQVGSRNSNSPDASVDLQPQATGAQLQNVAGGTPAAVPPAAPAAAPSEAAALRDSSSSSSADESVQSVMNMMAPAVQPEADPQDSLYAEGPTAGLGSLDINSFKKKKKHHSTAPHKHSTAPHKHSTQPRRHSSTPSKSAKAPTRQDNTAPASSSDAVNAAATTVQQASPAAAAATTAQGSAQALTAQQLAAAYAPPTAQETASIATRLKEVLGGSDAETLGDSPPSFQSTGGSGSAGAAAAPSFQSGSNNSGGTGGAAAAPSFQSGAKNTVGGGGAAAATPSQDGAAAAQAAVQRASDAVAQLQQSAAANLGRRLLRA